MHNTMGLFVLTASTGCGAVFLLTAVVFTVRAVAKSMTGDSTDEINDPLKLPQSW